MSREGQIWEREATFRRGVYWYLCLGEVDSKFGGYRAYLLLSLDGDYAGEGTLIERGKQCLDEPLPPSPAFQRWRRII